jgi:hypothetical protein
VTLAVHGTVLAHLGQLEPAAEAAAEAMAGLGRVSNPLDLLAGEVADTLVQVVGALIDAHRWDLAAPLLADVTALHRLLVLAGSDEHLEFLQSSLQLATHNQGYCVLVVLVTASMRSWGRRLARLVARAMLGSPLPRW